MWPLEKFIKCQGEHIVLSSTDRQVVWKWNKLKRRELQEPSTVSHLLELGQAGIGRRKTRNKETNQTAAETKKILKLTLPIFVLNQRDCVFRSQDIILNFIKKNTHG